MSLKSRFGILTLASALSMATPLLATQDTGKAKPAATRPATAAVQLKLSIPLTGLSAENAEKVHAALGELAYTAWSCPDCKMTQDLKGQCTHCKKELTALALKCLAEIKADAAGGLVTANLNMGTQVKLSDIEHALAGASVKLDAAKLTLSGTTQLLVQGPGSADAAKKFEQSLKTAKLFETMEIKHAVDSRDYVISARIGTTATTQAALVSAIAHAGEGFKLVDVVWIAPKQVS